jgi:hypothetical protein
MTILGIGGSLILGSCGGTSSKNASDAGEVASYSGLSDSELFKLQVSDSLVQKWGLTDHEERLFFIKSYSDEKRNYQSQEIESVITDYCLPVALLLSDSTLSGAKSFFNSHSTPKGI